MLTERLAKEAVELALPAIRAAMEKKILRRKQLHIILGTRNVPPVNPMDVSPEVYPEFVYAHMETDGRPYDGPFEKVAYSKAVITWRTGLPSRIVQQQYPHLLLPGDTRHGGSWIEMNVIGSASGVQSHFDEWASRICVSSVIALACDYRVRVEEAMTKDDAFLPIMY